MPWDPPRTRAECSLWQCPTAPPAPPPSSPGERSGGLHAPDKSSGFKGDSPHARAAHASDPTRTPVGDLVAPHAHSPLSLSISRMLVPPSSYAREKPSVSKSFSARFDSTAKRGFSCLASISTASMRSLGSQRRRRRERAGATALPPSSWRGVRGARCVELTHVWPRKVAPVAHDALGVVQARVEDDVPQVGCPHLVYLRVRQREPHPSLLEGLVNRPVLVPQVSGGALELQPLLSTYAVNGPCRTPQLRFRPCLQLRAVGDDLLCGRAMRHVGGPRRGRAGAVESRNTSGSQVTGQGMSPRHATWAVLHGELGPMARMTPVCIVCARCPAFSASTEKGAPRNHAAWSLQQDTRGSRTILCVWWDQNH